MITCAQCIQQLKPEDPRVRSGRYRLCSCDYCSKPSYFRELEEVQKDMPAPRPIVNVTYKMDARSTPAFKELKEQIALTNGRLDKYFEDKKKVKRKYTISK